MPARPNRLERITNLVLALLETARPMSLREIGSTVAGYPPEPGALRQAFERDKRTLRDGGIPISVERLDNEDQVGYRILPEDYYLPDLSLQTDEQEALAFALAAVRVEGGLGADVASKLGLTKTAELMPVALLPALPALGIVQEALRSRTALSFAYHGRERVVQGYGLSFKEGSWYLVGLDTSASAAGEKRTFRVDRFESEPILLEGEHYELPTDFDVAREVRFARFEAEAGDQATEVLIDVDVRDVSMVLARVGDGALVSREPDGSAKFSFKVGDEAGFVDFVVGFGDGIEVLEPPALRRRTVEVLKAAAQRR